MVKANTAQEPSMEEILASIRRIISDDAPGGVAAPSGDDAAPQGQVSEEDLDRLFAAVPATEGEQGGAGVLELTDDFADPMGGNALAAHEEPDVIAVDAVSPPPEAVRERPAAPERPSVSERPTAPERPSIDRPPVERPAAERARRPDPERLISPETDSAVNSAFNTLAHTILSHNARTLEDLVKEMLRPMLKAWLDENLPSIVERQVRHEIERVSRGR